MSVWGAALAVAPSPHTTLFGRSTRVSCTALWAGVAQWGAGPAWKVPPTIPTPMTPEPTWTVRASSRMGSFYQPSPFWVGPLGTGAGDGHVLCLARACMCTPVPACMCVIVLVCTCVLVCVLTRPCARVCMHVCTQARAFLQQTFAQFLLGASPCESQGHAARTQMGRLRIPQRAMAPPLCPPVLPSPSKASSRYPRPHRRLPRPDSCRGAHPELHCSATQGAEPQLHQPDHPLKGAACLRAPPNSSPLPVRVCPPAASVQKGLWVARQDLYPLGATWVARGHQPSFSAPQ